MNYKVRIHRALIGHSLTCGAAIYWWLSVLVLAGCQSDVWPGLVPVRGEVQYNGAPLGEGTVVYLPSEPGAMRQATGAIQKDGTFILTTHAKDDGVMPGKYDIVIYAYEPHPGEPKSRAEMEATGGGIKRGFIIPAKYANPATSGLSDTVDDSHSGFKTIELSD